VGRKDSTSEGGSQGGGGSGERETKIRQLSQLFIGRYDGQEKLKVRRGGVWKISEGGRRGGRKDTDKTLWGRDR